LEASRKFQRRVIEVVFRAFRQGLIDDIETLDEAQRIAMGRTMIAMIKIKSKASANDCVDSSAPVAV
jgi:hypothetical protein